MFNSCGTLAYNNKLQPVNFLGTFCTGMQTIVNQFENSGNEPSSIIYPIALDNGTKKVSSFRRILAQVLAGSAKILLLFDLGALIAFKTIIIANILNAPKQPSFTDNDASWFASLQFIGQPVGCLMAAAVLDIVGRKKAMLLLNIPLFLGWFLMAIAESVTLLNTASVISGVGIGFIEAPTVTYIGEITEPKIRGIMTSFGEVVIGLATLLVYLLSVYLDWRTVAYICSAIPVVSVLAITQIPESPIWLLAKGRTKDAEKSLCWLRGWTEPENIKEEFTQLVLYKNNKISCKQYTAHSNKVDISDETLEKNDKNTQISVADKSNQFDIKEPIQEIHYNNGNDQSDEKENFKLATVIADLSQPTMLRALLIMLGFFFFNAANGYIAVRSFAVPVFKELGVSVEPYRANVISAVAMTLGYSTLMLLVRFTGKRKLVIVSSLGSAVTCIALGVYAYQIADSTVQSLTPFFIYTAHVYFASLGILSVPWLYVSEIFPYRGRGAATGITAASTYLYAFFVTKTFYSITDAIKLSGTFFFYGVISLIGCIFLYILLPETEGKTLQDIEESAEKKIKS